MAVGAKQDFSMPPIGIVCAFEAHEKFTRLV
jgi:hypothetical protein